MSPVWLWIRWNDFLLSHSLQCTLSGGGVVYCGYTCMWYVLPSVVH